MGTLLTRRWYGVSGWAVVMALLVCMIACWLVPGINWVHRWTFDGVAIVQEFTNDGVVVVSLFHDQSSTRSVRLDLISGSSQEYLSEPDRSTHPGTSCGFVLSHTGYAFEEKATLSLKDNATNVEQQFTINEPGVRITEIYKGTISRQGARVGLSTAGYSAMSSDGRWLLVQSSKGQLWTPFVLWMESELNWKPSFLPITQRHHVHALDRGTNTLTKCDLEVGHSPAFIVHPSNQGFLVVSFDGIMGVPSTAKPLSTISWYRLPLDARSRTWGQWWGIASIAAFPLFLSWLRRNRGKVTVPSGAAG
jgi:hypothetical protein